MVRLGLKENLYQKKRQNLIHNPRAVPFNFDSFMFTLINMMDTEDMPNKVVEVRSSLLVFQCLKKLKAT